MSFPHSTTDGIVLYSSTGVSEPKHVYGANPSIPSSNGYTQGKMDGPASYFVVYSVPGYNQSDRILMRLLLSPPLSIPKIQQMLDLT